jgi:hypothetical protein
MAGSGPAPKKAGRRRSNAPARGEWKPSPGNGWQHGTARKRIPDPPVGLMPATLAAWGTWMRSWFASHWTPADLPVLLQIIKLYDKVERNQAISAELTQYRQLLDSYGITPKGQQDRRWAPPEADEAETPAPTPKKPKPGAQTTAAPYAGLELVVDNRKKASG